MLVRLVVTHTGDDELVSIDFMSRIMYCILHICGREWFDPDI